MDLVDGFSRLMMVGYSNNSILSYSLSLRTSYLSSSVGISLAVNMVYHANNPETVRSFYFTVHMYGVP